MRQTLVLFSVMGLILVIGTTLSYGQPTPFSERVISETDMTSTFAQFDPVVASAADGHFVAVWLDQRNDGHYYDIIAQAYDAQGNPIGANVVVNDDESVTGMWSVAIDMNSAGEFVITWIEKQIGANLEWGSNRNKNVYAQRFDADGNRLGTNFRVNDVPAIAWEHRPDVAVTESGAFMIVWEVSSFDPIIVGDVHAQCYDRNGTPIGTNFQVNEELEEESHYLPRVTALSDSLYLVAFYDTRDGMKIYGQLYSTIEGTPVGENFPISDENAIRAYEPDISTNRHSGQTLVVWQDERCQSRCVYGQYFDGDGNVIGDNFRVSDEDAIMCQRPDVAMFEEQGFAAVWEDYRLGYAELYARTFRENGDPLGTSFPLSTGSNYSESPSLTRLNNNRFAAIWHDAREFEYNIYLQHFNTSGELIGDVARVNDDSTGTVQVFPVLSVTNDSTIIVCWEDQRIFTSHIFQQRLNRNGALIGNNVRVSDDNGNPQQLHQYPDMAQTPSGNYLLVWEDSRNGDHDIYGQYFQPDGTPINQNIAIFQEGQYNFQPAVAFNSEGEAIVVWEYSNGSNYRIRGQRLNPNGNPTGEPFYVGETPVFPFQQNSDVTYLSNGESVIVWEASGNPYDRRIFAQRFAENGSPISQPFQINSSSGVAYYSRPQIAAAPDDSYAIVWTDYYPNENEDIYLQRYDSNNNPIGENIRVNDDEIDGKPQTFPVCAYAPNGDFIVVWTDYRNSADEHIIDPDIYGQRYDADGTPLGGNFQISEDPSTQGQEYPDVAINSDGIVYVTWHDSRNQRQGFDIYIKSFDFYFSSVEPTSSVAVTPSRLTLHQNYPNPFNPTTTITYDLPREMPVTLRIYDLSGRLVQTLLDDAVQSAGNHAVVWHTGELPSGIYLYDLQTKSTHHRRRAILLR